MKIRRLPVQRDDFEAGLFPDDIVTINYKREFSHEEYAKLKMGILGVDSTFAFFENDHLYLYGRYKDKIFGEYDVTLSPTEIGAEIVDIKVKKMNPDVMIQYLNTHLQTIINHSLELPLTSSSWNNLQSMPDNHSEHKIDESFTERQFCHLMWGELPLSMDDHWFVYGTDMTLYYHRSWTGICVFQVNFEKVANNYRATSVLVNNEMTDFGLQSVLRMMRFYGDYYPYRYEITDD